jgi:hypothetical protein
MWPLFINLAPFADALKESGTVYVACIHTTSGVAACKGVPWRSSDIKILTKAGCRILVGVKGLVGALRALDRGIWDRGVTGI